MGWLQTNGKRLGLTYIFVVAGIAILLVRLLRSTDPIAAGAGPLDKTALLYFGIPFLISALIYHLSPRPAGRSRLALYLVHMLKATVILLAASIILFEGFVCVLMFMPLYFISVSFYFATVPLSEDAANATNRKVRIVAIPCIALVLSLEGTTDALTADRYNEVTYRATTKTSVAQLKANMAKPIVFPETRHWFLSIFPLPDRIVAGTLNAGDIHTLDFTYSRWFVTNTHRGEMQVRIAEVGPNHVRTEIVQNTSYLSAYMRSKARTFASGKRRTELTFRSPSSTGDCSTRAGISVRCRPSPPSKAPNT